MSKTDALLAGPRGRRLLLAFALEAERVRGLEQDSDSLRYAVVLASRQVPPAHAANCQEQFLMLAREVAAGRARWETTPMPGGAPRRR